MKIDANYVTRLAPPEARRSPNETTEVTRRARVRFVFVVLCFWVIKKILPLRTSTLPAQPTWTSPDVDAEHSHQWATFSADTARVSASVGPRFVLRKWLNQLIFATLLQAQIEFEIAKPYYRKDP